MLYYGRFLEEKRVIVDWRI